MNIVVQKYDEIKRKLFNVYIINYKMNKDYILF
jgi:hypothetical protein